MPRAIGVSKSLITCHWTLLYIYNKNGKSNRKNYNSNKYNSNNDNTIHSERPDQTDLILLCVYFFLLRNFKFLLKLERKVFKTK